jgi:hypothetical protein
MFDQIKNTLEFISKNHAIKFRLLVKNIELELSPMDLEKLKFFLIDENIVEDFDGEGNQFGREPRYKLTTYGHSFLTEMKEYEILDQILSYLNKNKTAYLDIQYICRQINAVFSETYRLRLEQDGMVECISDKSGYSYKLSRCGKNWILVKGGYRHQMTLSIEKAIIEYGTNRKKKTIPSQTINIQAENYFGNTNSTIEKQGIFNEVKKEEKKNNWLQVIYWIIGIFVSLTTLYIFFKPFILAKIK